MNTQHSPRKTTLLAAVVGTIAMVMAAATAQADMLSPALYGEKLDRCAVELRSELNTAGAARLRHTVTDIDKVGVWYVFDIQSETLDETGAVTGQATTLCKAHRWTEQTVVEVRDAFPVSDMRLASAR